MYKSLCSLFSAVLICAVGCSKPAPTDGTSSAAKTSVLSTDRINVRYAQGFTVEYFPTYKLVQVKNPWRGADVSFTYVLVPRSATLPTDLPPTAQIVRTPVERVVLTSTTYCALLDKLDLVDKILGISDFRFVNTESVRKRIESGRITLVGNGDGMSGGANVELLYSLQPDVVFAYATGNKDYDVHGKLMKAGIPTVLSSGYMEASPLGRAEWIKFLALFFNEEKKGATLFDQMAAEYEAVAELAKHATSHPTVFCNIPYRGTWYVPGGRSYMATYLKDAGANYLWQDDESAGSLPLSVEVVAAKAVKADYWLHQVGSRSIADVLAIDERNRNFEALKKGQLFNRDARVNEHGGNDYWESGVSNPHLVLKDLVSVFHPGLLKDHELVWYRKLPATKDSNTSGTE